MTANFGSSFRLAWHGVLRMHEVGKKVSATFNEIRVIIALKQRLCISAIAIDGDAPPANWQLIRLRLGV